ncbi:hypothetical protein BDB01DRAFT_836001 [Pilobolus umbonatus]|nr:hypothetical protein BDB01DRAFT_836001 [Pilobolus umbonatus]
MKLNLALISSVVLAQAIYAASSVSMAPQEMASASAVHASASAAPEYMEKRGVVDFFRNLMFMDGAASYASVSAAAASAMEASYSGASMAAEPSAAAYPLYRLRKRAEEQVSAKSAARASASAEFIAPVASAEFIAPVVSAASFMKREMESMAPMASASAASFAPVASAASFMKREMESMVPMASASAASFAPMASASAGFNSNFMKREVSMEEVASASAVFEEVASVAAPQPSEAVNVEKAVEKEASLEEDVFEIDVAEYEDIEAWIPDDVAESQFKGYA